ncbi:MAG: exodeoxyribonuclease VII small subunit [Proteobacteria bacterium]|nr:exodeoxyribonuclease VII small subunit [Pseudomonadota bacterium]
MAETKSQSFEEAMKTLEGLVTQLEKGDMSLDEALAAFEKGVALHGVCQKKLREAEMRVEKVLAAQDGQVTTQPFETENR